MSPDVRTAASDPLAPPAVLTDEAALKRQFETEFDALLSAAHEQLGADAAAMAPRVVEGAFVHVWNQRALISNSQELKAALTDELRHGVARALSRRSSAGRLAGGKQAHVKHSVASEARADVWAAIEKGIHPTETTHGDAAAGRREAASHMKAATKRPSWVVPVAIGVFAIVVSVGGMFYVDRLGEDAGALALVSSASIQPITSSPGQIGSVTLGDGSKMRIGPETKVFIPDAFPDKARVIKVEGTAQFDVAKSGAAATHEFRVIVKRTQVIATGTSFVVYAYPGDSLAAVLVREGSVTVKSGKATTTLEAGKALVIDNGTQREPTAEERAEAFGWVDNKITVQHKQLREVLAALTRWFNYDVKVPDLPLLDRDASIDVPLDSSGLAIKQVEQSANVQFAYEGETKVFRDASKNASKKKK